MYTFIIFLTVLLFTVWIYGIIISFKGWKYNTTHIISKQQHTFLILIPAHNEEAVVGNLVENLKKMDYPEEAYEICVIADHCADETAAVARKEGAYVIEHTYLEDEPRGKPHAMRFAINLLKARKKWKKYDAVIVLDADNLVDSNFLSVFDYYLSHGHTIMQCFLDSKNANDNWVTRGYSSAFYHMNRSVQYAKNQWGLSASLGGTGFCVRRDVFDEIGWTAESLVEDLEFSIQAIINGYKVTWVGETRIYDEKPLSIKVSMKQRLRWTRGHWDVCFHYTPALIQAFLKQYKWQYIDSLIFLWNPGRSIISILLTLISVVNVVVIDFHVPYFMLIITSVYQMILLYHIIKRDHIFEGTFLQYYIGFLGYSLTFLPIFFAASVSWKNRHWAKTAHNVATSLDNIIEQKAG